MSFTGADTSSDASIISSGWRRGSGDVDGRGGEVGMDRARQYLYYNIYVKNYMFL